MKTIADLKRKIILGIKLDCYNHWFKESLGIREIGHVQSNSFALLTKKKGVENVFFLSWCDFPKKNSVIFVDDKTFNIINPDNNELILTYTFI